jgi:pyruvate formate-lyase/glycerol dehydratase family glycyl radical enzyme
LALIKFKENAAMSKVTVPAGITAREKLTRGQRLWNKEVNLRHLTPVSLERARLVTASWKETEGLPIPLRRARAFEKIVGEIPIFIDDEQLLAGNYGSWLMAGEWHPELSVTWVLERFDALFDAEKSGVRGAEEEKKIIESGCSLIGKYYVMKNEDIAAIKQIAEYWKDKSAEACYLRYIGEEENKRISEIDFRGAFIVMGGNVGPTGGWYVPGYSKVLEKGLLGILSDVEQEIQATPYVDENSRDKRIFLESLIIVIKAGIRYATRYAALAKEMAKTAKPTRKAELEKMAEICHRVPASPARTFWEALQAMWFCHLFMFWESKAGGMSPGRVDQFLYPFYKKDLEEGRITREEAIELLELLRCLFSSYRNFEELSYAEHITGEAEWFNCTLGGQTVDGKDATNEMSYLWLEAAKRVGSPHPTLTIRVHENLNEDFAMMAAELAKMGRGYPAWFGDRTTIPFLLAQGVTLCDARNYAVGGCVISQVPGKMSTVRVMQGNIPKMFELTLHNGIDPLTGKQLGPKTGKFENFRNYDELWEAFTQQIKYWLIRAAADTNKGSSFASLLIPQLTASILFDDCIKRGLPSNGGGSHYQQGMWYFLSAGPMDVVDSLAAIKKCVYEDRLIAPKQLMKALAANFEGDENQSIRRLLLAVPKYGNDEDYVDLIARDFYSMLDRELAKIDGCYGTRYVSAPHTVAVNGPMGKVIGALPSSRLAWTALADGNMSPCQGMDKKGPTAVIRSAGKIDYLPMQGSLLNMKFTPATLKTEDDLKKCLGLVKTYLIDYGGKHIQFNVVDKKTLLDAQEHPENYKSLIVRVAGYSAFWVELNRLTQNDIISRTEQTF